MFQFVQIGVQMFDRKPVIRADNRALQEAPDELPGFAGFGDISSALKAAEREVRGLLFSTRSF
jgi:hypothetical protein